MRLACISFQLQGFHENASTTGPSRQTGLALTPVQ